MKRLLLGLSALGLLLVWLALFLSGSEENWSRTVASGCLRAGLVLGALWLAFPQVLVVLERVPAWMMGCMGLGLLAIVRWPRAAVVVVPGMFALWFLRPRPPRSKSSSSGTKRA